MTNDTCLCGSPAVWRVNPELGTPDLVEALGVDGINMDPMLIVEACCTDTSDAVLCQECADDLMEQVEADRVADNTTRREQWYEQFAVFGAGAVEKLDELLSRRPRLPPPLIRLRRQT